MPCASDLRFFFMLLFDQATQQLYSRAMKFAVHYSAALMSRGIQTAQWQILPLTSILEV